MGFYTRQVLPRVTRWLLDHPRIHELRMQTARPLSGDIVELGFGAGLNLPALPAAVTSLRAVDPDQVGRKMAKERLRDTSVPVEFVGLDAARLPFDDASVDGVLSTFTLCSIEHIGQALSEVRRVLRPGAPFCFLEHGASHLPRLRKWQRRINPVYAPIAGGCRLDRDIPALLERAGFELVTLDAFDLGRPTITSHWFQGVAVLP